MRLGAGELVLILGVLLLLWGPSRLPDIGRSLGRSIAEFRRGLRGDSTGDEPGSPPGPESSPTEP